MSFTFSATSLKGFRACSYQWYLQRILKLPRPQGKGAATGEKHHKDLEFYLRDGVPLPKGSPLHDIVHELPDPKHPEVTAELEFLHTRFLEDGLFVRGKIDIIYPGAIIDLKTGKDTRRYALSEEQLLEDEQAILYAYWYFQHYPDEHWVWVRLQYVSLDGQRPHKTEACFRRGTVMAQCRAMLPDVRAMAALTKESAKRNENHCGAFGGCPYIGPCVML